MESSYVADMVETLIEAAGEAGESLSGKTLNRMAHAALRIEEKTDEAHMEFIGKCIQAEAAEERVCILTLLDHAGIKLPDNIASMIERGAHRKRGSAVMKELKSA